ncbi:hypothetical protein ACQKB2_17865 [Mycobacterium tuberculosis]
MGWATPAAQRLLRQQVQHRSGNTGTNNFGIRLTGDNQTGSAA